LSASFKINTGLVSVAVSGDATLITATVTNKDSKHTALTLSTATLGSLPAVLHGDNLNVYHLSLFLALNAVRLKP